MAQPLSLEERLRRLTAVPAMAGFEDAMIRTVVEELALLSIPIEIDPLGNVLAQISAPGQDAGPVVLLNAHTDEIGLIVRKIETDGFLRCDRVGGVPERVLPGLAMLVGTRGGDMIEAVVGTKAHHLTDQDEKYRVVPVEDIYLDAGFRDETEAAATGIQPGSPVVYQRQFVRRESRVFSPALDDRAGCAILIAVAERLHEQHLPCQLWLAFSVQEEFSLQGIVPAVRRIRPDIAVAVDIAVACDTPDLTRTSVRLAGGPALNTYSFHGRGTLAGVIPNPKLLRHLESVAERNHLPVQHNVFFGGLTDGSYVQLQNNGIPTIEIGFPTRYTHSALECCDLTDLHATVDLLEAFSSTLPKDLDLRRG